MATERRTEAEIRQEIATERDQLAAAVAGLREGVDEKRKVAATVGGVLVAGLATAAALRIVRRLSRR